MALWERRRLLTGERESARLDLHEARELAAGLGVAGAGLVREATMALGLLDAS
ncbi:MAG TPA: hypothetical protein VFI47_06540 [Acidimicrobiales bacterium]|nr:hypothetical protein [Acidimicrobiales bacterium]